jgi:hypothetical protein
MGHLAYRVSPPKRLTLFYLQRQGPGPISPFRSGPTLFSPALIFSYGATKNSPS